MQGRCEKHLFEGAEDTCGKCGFEFCGECLVYAFGAKKPPLCIPCAVAAAGIRSTAGNRPAAPPRELRQMQKERKLAFKRFRRESEPEPVFAPMPEPDMDPVPMPAYEDNTPLSSPALGQI
jgi:hypothetical protein